MNSFAATDKDLESLRQRLLENFARGAPPEAVVGEILALQNPDGGFRDIDYADGNSVNWAPFIHLERLTLLARALGNSEGTTSENSRLTSALAKALAFWVEAKPTSANWWYGQIGIARELGPIALLMKGKVPESLRQELSALVFRSNYGLKAHETNQGQNAIGLAASSIYKGLVEKNDAFIASGFAAIAKEIQITTGSGIQPDGSFHQHWGVLYNGGYGRGFLLETAAWASAAQGTPWAFPPDRLAILSHLLLDGDRWMIWRRTFDFNTTGREITRSDIDHQAGQVTHAARQIAALYPPRAPEAAALARHIEGAPAAALGARIFWRSSYAVGRRPGGLITVNMSEDRTPGTESIRQENVQGDWLAHGATFIYHTGNEYEGIFPVWNWLRVPGVTNPQIRKVRNRQRGAFAGGVSDGLFGVAAENLHMKGIKARKAWFFLQDGLVALGAGIRSDSPIAVTTTVQQSLLADTLTLSDANGTRNLSQGAWDLRGPAWISHDGTGYVLPESAPFHLQAQRQTGSFHAINPGNFPATAPEISKDVFSLWFNHGPQPHAATYHYAVLPGFDAQDTAAWAQNPPYQVLANTPECQALFASQNRLGLAVFYEPGSVAFTPELTLTTDTPAAVLYRELADGTTHVAVANPKNEEVRVTITLTRTPQNESPDSAKEKTQSELTFDLPGSKEEAGRSVIQIVDAGA